MNLTRFQQIRNTILVLLGIGFVYWVYEYYLTTCAKHDVNVGDKVKVLVEPTATTSYFKRKRDSDLYRKKERVKSYGLELRDAVVIELRKGLIYENALLYVVELEETYAKYDSHIFTVDGCKLKTTENSSES